MVSICVCVCVRGGGGGGVGDWKLNYTCGGVPKIFSVHYKKYNRDLQSFAHVRNVYIHGNSICHMYAPSN